MPPRVTVTSTGPIAPSAAAPSESLYHDGSHIDRASLDALPSRPGIYIFRDERQRPLYIGKSVNIRSRVLSHLRTPAEARMLRQSRRVDFQRTAGEIGALLLESRLIKDMQPLYNKKLRLTRDMCSLRFAPGHVRTAPAVVYARDEDFTGASHLYGLFGSRKAALERLQAIADETGLCPALCGLEATMAGRACFAHQLGRCRGACAGTEPVADHDARLLAALEAVRVIAWPYDGAVGIVEESDGWRQTHVVDRWFYLGTIDDGEGGVPVRRPAARGFDVDTYRILVKPLLQGQLRIEPVASTADFRSA